MTLLLLLLLLMTIMHTMYNRILYYITLDHSTVQYSPVLRRQFRASSLFCGGFFDQHELLKTDHTINIIAIITTTTTSINRIAIITTINRYSQYFQYLIIAIRLRAACSAGGSSTPGPTLCSAHTSAVPEGPLIENNNNDKNKLIIHV